MVSLGATFWTTVFERLSPFTGTLNTVLDSYAAGGSTKDESESCQKSILRQDNHVFLRNEGAPQPHFQGRRLAWFINGLSNSINRQDTCLIRGVRSA